MLVLDDAVALSFWSGGRKLKILDNLRRESQRSSLESMLETLGGGRQPGDLARTLRRRAATALSSARRLGIDVIVWGDPRYPALLTPIPDAPLVLWLKGNPAALSQPSVAIVGSRAATPYGLEAASRLAGDLAAAGALIVSGLARGVDSAAHRAALRAGGETAAVLGSGVDVVYPPEHVDLAQEITSHGVLLSELPPGTPPLAFHFPARNRIISGLSLAVVVVEAAERSGSLITASSALDQGRAVMAVPGSILSGRHRGCHALIRDGAAVVESAEDVLAELRTSSLRPAAEVAADATLSDPILARMTPGESYDADSLALETGLVPARLLSRLLELELRGAIRRLDGGRFVRAGRTC
ncbi:MAG TPA: DNA-processing protein DprA [Vicinamibacterales bacterium]|jgi:DNA processing protein